MSDLPVVCLLEHPTQYTHIVGILAGIKIHQRTSQTRLVGNAFYFMIDAPMFASVSPPRCACSPAYVFIRNGFSSILRPELHVHNTRWPIATESPPTRAAILCYCRPGNHNRYPDMMRIRKPFAGRCMPS